MKRKTILKAALLLVSLLFLNSCLTVGSSAVTEKQIAETENETQKTEQEEPETAEISNPHKLDFYITLRAVNPSDSGENFAPREYTSYMTYRTLNGEPIPKDHREFQVLINGEDSFVPNMEYTTESELAFKINNNLMVVPGDKVIYEITAPFLPEPIVMTGEIPPNPTDFTIEEELLFPNELEKFTVTVNHNMRGKKPDGLQIGGRMFVGDTWDHGWYVEGEPINKLPYEINLIDYSTQTPYTHIYALYAKVDNWLYHPSGWGLLRIRSALSNSIYNVEE